MVGSQAEAAGEPAQRGGGMRTLGGEERVEFGDHGRLALVRNRSQSCSYPVATAARGAAANAAG